MQRYAFLLCLLVTVPGYCQVLSADSIHSLQGIEVQATRMNRFSAGVKIDRIDSSLWQHSLAANLSALLADHSAAFIRSYGTGGLATLSFRGTQSTQSAVFWNNFNLNLPNMAMTDLSHIPSLFFDEIEVQYGGNSALFGSGVIGGSLHLANHSSFTSPFKSSVLLSVGSFSDYTVATRMSAGNQELSWSGAVFGNRDQNDFSYDDLYGVNRRLTHAQSTSAGAIQQIEYRVAPNQLLSAGIWWQQSAQEIPATMVMSFSDQQQENSSLRSTLQWMYLTDLQRLQVRAALFHEQLHFTSPVATIDALYNLKTLALESEYKRKLGNRSETNAGISYRFLEADVPYYSGIKVQPEIALFASFLHLFPGHGWKSNLNFRQEIINGYRIPFCPSLGLEGPVVQNIRARVSVSRNFRVPTLNDRFWNPGGNPGLLPESSWNQEAGLDFIFPGRDNPVNGSFSVTVYNMLITNLIQWLSVSSAIWSPQNVQQVWSRGVETSARVNYRKGAWEGFLLTQYNYTPSTYREVKGSTDPYSGNQLIYTPLNKLSSIFSMNWKKYSVLLNGILTGRRFVQKDNEKELPGFFLTNLSCGRDFRGENSGFSLRLEIHNLFNVQYQSVQYYPEPGRSIKLNLLFNLKPASKK